VIALTLLLLSGLAKEDGPLATMPPFTLTERNGSKVSLEDLQGKVWIASFVMTRCPDGKCPQVTRTVSQLQDTLADRRDVRLVTFTVDPDTDDPTELNRYAQDHGAKDDGRWLFLTGDYDVIDGLMKAIRVRGGEGSPRRVDHSQKLVLVGRTGEVLGYFDGYWNTAMVPEADFERNLLRLRRAVDKALQPELPAWMPQDFPAFHALLNAVATVLLLVGYIAIRLKQTRVHISCMIITLLISTLFLASYLFFHLVVKEGRPTRFVDQAPDAPAWVATTYAVILLSHTILAIFATPMALTTAYFGLRRWWPAHTRLSRITFPIWLYVTVTGVMVYWMLYRLYPGP
jgi:protein SCO1/2/putative membrane protein